MKRLLFGAAVLAPLSGGEVLGQGAPFLDTGDSIIAIDVDAVFGLNGRYPAAEGPAKAIDGSTAGNSKYLNFGREGSGFIVSPALDGAVESFQIRTANDQPSRDPASWALYGYNGALSTVDSGATPAINADGLAEAWVLIGSGDVTLPGDPTINNDQRGVLGPIVDVPTAAAYDHYKMIFPTVKDAALANSMQLAEIQFYTDDAATLALLAPTDPVIAVDEVKAWSGSGFPAAENPPKLLDGDSATKYLNANGKNSGFIVTNAEGPSPLHTMRLTAANDADGRDPTSYELWGTNESIQSEENTDGLGGEAWTLISSGAVALPPGAEGRFKSVDVEIGSTTPYESYKLIFPTLRDPNSALMQIADVQFFGVPEPSTALLTLIFAAAGLAGVRRR